MIKFNPFYSFDIISTFIKTAFWDLVQTFCKMEVFVFKKKSFSPDLIVTFLCAWRSRTYIKKIIIFSNFRALCAHVLFVSMCITVKQNKKSRISFHFISRQAKFIYRFIDHFYFKAVSVKQKKGIKNQMKMMLHYLLLQGLLFFYFLNNSGIF